jgi:hypothetical protein
LWFADGRKTQQGSRGQVGIVAQIKLGVVPRATGNGFNLQPWFAQCQA